MNKTMYMLVCAITVVFCFFATAYGASPDDRWVPMNPEVPGTNGSISAMARHGDYLYIGGEFSVVKNILANNVARLHIPTGEWSALGSGINGSISAIAIDGNGNVYVGGGFTIEGSVEDYNVAKWDGTQWSVLGIGMSSYVSGLAVDEKGNLYVGGDFEKAGGVAVNHIAKWDGAQWNAIGNGTNDTVLSLAIDSEGNLYVGGYFSAVWNWDPNSYVLAESIAKWDGIQWSALGEGCGFGVGYLALDGDGNLYASSAGGPTPKIARWDGVKWGFLGETLGPLAIDMPLAIDGEGDLYASYTINNEKYIAKWDGLTWNPLGDKGVVGNIYSLVFDGDGNLYAGGWFRQVDDVHASNIAKWDGAQWEAMGSGIISLFPVWVVGSLAIDHEGSCYMGGRFTMAVDRNGIAKRDGAEWDLEVAQFGSGNSIKALAIDNTGNLYAGGSFKNAGTVEANYVAKWDGLLWGALGGGMGPTSSGSTTASVSALAVDGSGLLYAGGSFATAGGVEVNNIAKWDGLAWSPLGNGVDGKVFALVFDSEGNLYVGGDFTRASGVEMNHVAKWDGSQWSALENGVDGGSTEEVLALASDSMGNVYAGGRFKMAGNVEANNVAKWDGVQWSLLTSGMDGSIDALVVDSAGNLYAGGEFMMAGGFHANHIAKWDKTGWRALGSGMNGKVEALAMDDGGNLYVGGSFTTAGGKMSPYIAKYITGEIPDSPDNDNVDDSDNGVDTDNDDMNDGGNDTDNDDMNDGGNDTDNDDMNDGVNDTENDDMNDGGNDTDMTDMVDADNAEGGSGCGCTMLF